MKQKEELRIDIFMIISNWKNSFDLHGFYKTISAL